MSKKILSLVCVCALALCLAVPAFAAAGDPIGNGASVDFTGTPAEGEIAVVMQTGKTNLYVNPYGLPYTLGYGEVYATAGATTFDKTKDYAIKEPDTATEGFFSDTAVIRNNGTIALDVKVTMTTTEKGNAKVVAAQSGVPAAGNIDAQYMYGNLEITTATMAAGSATVTTTAATGSDPAVKTEETGVNVVTPDWDSKETVAIPAGSGTAGTAGTPSAVADTGVVLAAFKSEHDENTGVTTNTPGLVAYRLAGTTVPADEAVSPATVPALWAEDDVADVTVAFTFTPHVDTPVAPPVVP